ncbi:MAG: alanine racemase [Spirochaetia bacterium]|nr:alanine racemase [Spirochaetia bacterium]
MKKKETIENYLSSEHPYPVLQISKEALLNNLKLFKKLISKSEKKVKILIPVKANAYGFGISTLYPFFNEAPIDYLGVANPWEGRYLRSLGYKKPILNLGGFYPENADDFFKYDIIPSITDVWQISLLQLRASALNKKMDIHLKWDMGMGRIGLKQEDLYKITDDLKKSKNLKIKGLFTHFPLADSTNKKPTRDLLNKFLKTMKEFLSVTRIKRDSVIMHAANSYGTLLYKESHLDMIRPGLAFYGYYQNREDKEKYDEKFKLKPALRLLARPISIRNVKKGESISYGSTYTVKDENMAVGVIPLGYADGILRALSNSISFEGHPLLGRVTMDQIMLGNVKSAQTPIEIIGEKSLPLEYWAQKANTVTYEILTGLGHRLRRELI